MEKVGNSNTGIVRQAIRLRCFQKYKLKDPKGKEERKNIRNVNNLRVQSKKSALTNTQKN
jgi:hypothetical protein